MTELRQAAENAADVLDEARTYVGCESWSPSMLEECERALRMLRAALAQPPAPTAQPAAVPPTIEAAHAMGAQGGPAVEGERLAFESWMRGHCWELSATWTGTQYRSYAEQGGDLDPRAMATRRLWAAWRDRAALATAQPAQQPGAEPDMRHPKIQALIGSRARCQIELMLVEQLIEDPDCDLTSMDMEYWGPMHDRLKEALTKAAPAQRQPLTMDEACDLVRDADLDWQRGFTLDPMEVNRYLRLIRAIEAAHGITAAPAAQKGEKL